MIREEIILHTEKIQRLGQSVYFQIKLPVDTERIIGIETGAIRQISGATSSGMYALFGGGGSFALREVGDPIVYDESFTIEKTETIGRLTLHTPDATGIFFQDDIRQRDTSPKYADFTQYPAVFDQWSHNTKRYETSINVKNCSNLVEGHFKDTWGALYNYHVIYQLNIYIWIEKSI